MVVRNSSEMQRLYIEQRNEEYRKMQNTRNSISLSSRRDNLLKEIKEGRLCKSAKERALRQLRNLEARLGIKGADYNSSEF